MPPMHYRTATQTRRGARSGYQESDDFEGLPVRQWRRGWVSVNTEPPKDADQEDDIWAEDPPFGMPKDTHLLPKYTQDLLRAARSSYTPLKRAAPDDDDEDDNYDSVKREKKEDEPAKEGFRVWGWKQLPRTVEKPLPSLLAKRHKNTITLASRAGLAHISGPTITRARVRRLDAAGNAYHQTITLAAGQEVDGEIISTEIVPAPEVKEEEKPVKRRPPPPKRKPKGPGRGRKKGIGKLPLPMPATRSQQQAGEGANEAEGTEGSLADLQTPGPGDEKAEGFVGAPDVRPTGSSDDKPDEGPADIKTVAGTGEGGDGAKDVVAGADATDIPGVQGVQGAHGVQGVQSVQGGSNVATPTIMIEDGEERQEFRDVDMVDSYITISDEEVYDEEDDRERGDGGEDSTLDVDGDTTANFEAQFQGPDQSQDMADSDGSEVIQPSSVEEPDDEPRNTTQEEELTISQPRFSPSGVSNLLSTSHFSSFRVEGSPLKNVVNLSPTEGSPMGSPAGGASVSGASYFEIQPASEIMDMDMDSGGEMVSETHMFGGMHDEATTSGNTPLFETVPGAVVASHDTPIFDDAPEATNASAGRDISEAPNASTGRDIPEAPDVSAGRDIPEAPEVTAEQDIPVAPEVSAGHDIPDDVPQTSDVQDVPAVQNVPDLHNYRPIREGSAPHHNCDHSSRSAVDAIFGLRKCPIMVEELPDNMAVGTDPHMLAYGRKLLALEEEMKANRAAESLKSTPLPMAPPRPHARSGPPSPVVQRQEGQNMKQQRLQQEKEQQRQQENQQKLQQQQEQQRQQHILMPQGVGMPQEQKLQQQQQQQQRQQHILMPQCGRMPQEQQEQQQQQQQQQQHIPMPIGMGIPPPHPPPPSSDSSAMFDTSGFLMDDPSTAFANFDGFDPALIGPVDGTEQFGGFGNMVDSSDNLHFDHPNNNNGATNAPSSHQGPS